MVVAGEMPPEPTCVPPLGDCADVVAWAPGGPSVRLVARATAECAAREARLQVWSPELPAQWPSWRAAAAVLGVDATWHHVVTGDLERVLVAGAPSRAALLVVEAATALSCGAYDLARHADVYVVSDASGGPTGDTLMHEPAVVVGVATEAELDHVLAVARHAAALTHRRVIVVHAFPEGGLPVGVDAEPGWGDALADRGGQDVPQRLVLTSRTVPAALRDHVEPSDVLVLGVHPPGADSGVHASLLAMPPCDLLLTAVSSEDLDGRPAGRLTLVVDA